MGKPTSTADPVEMLVMWFHHCGWSGTEVELKPSVWQGIEYGFECPKCGDDWPFEDDDTEIPEDDEYEWSASNRVRSQRANKAKFWCSKCDAAIVGQVGKCPKCGHVEDKKRKRGIAT